MSKLRFLSDYLFCFHVNFKYFFSSRCLLFCTDIQKEKNSGAQLLKKPTASTLGAEGRGRRSKKSGPERIRISAQKAILLNEKLTPLGGRHSFIFVTLSCSVIAVLDI